MLCEMHNTLTYNIIFNCIHIHFNSALNILFTNNIIFYLFFFLLKINKLHK